MSNPFLKMTPDEFYSFLDEAGIPYQNTSGFGKVIFEDDVPEVIHVTNSHKLTIAQENTFWMFPESITYAA